MSTTERHKRRKRRAAALLLLLLLVLGALGLLGLVGRSDTGAPGAVGTALDTSGPVAATSPEHAAGAAATPRRASARRAAAADPASAVDGASSRAIPAAQGEPVSSGNQAAPPGEDGAPPVPFGIAGSVHGLAVGVWTPIPVTITNPNDVPITVTALRVAVSGRPNGCDAVANFETRASSAPFTVPARVDAFTVPLAKRPAIRLRSLGTDQSRCRRQTLALSFSGSATRP